MDSRCNVIRHGLGVGWGGGWELINRHVDSKQKTNAFVVKMLDVFVIGYGWGGRTEVTWDVTLFALTRVKMVHVTLSCLC